MDIIHFKLSGKFGHFLRAETNVSLPSYPLPPRTVLLGLIGAVLGMEKDSPQTFLEPAFIAVKGKLPDSFWTTAKFYKTLPSKLDIIITRESGNSDTKQSSNPTPLRMQWLFNPEYEVWVSLPEKYHREFSMRLRDRRWHFTPYLGITEHMADLSWIGDFTCNPLPAGEHWVESLCRRDTGGLNVPVALKKELAIHLVRMPCEVSSERVFNHRDYMFEQSGKPLPVYAEHAFSVEGRNVVFM